MAGMGTWCAKMTRRGEVGSHDFGAFNAIMPTSDYHTPTYVHTCQSCLTQYMVIGSRRFLTPVPRSTHTLSSPGWTTLPGLDTPYSGTRTSQTELSPLNPG